MHFHFPDNSLPRRTTLHLAWQVSASHEETPPRTRSLHLVSDNFAHTRSFRLRLWGTPHTEVRSEGTRAHMNVVLPWRSGSLTATHNAPVSRAMQTLQLTARAGGRLWQGPWCVTFRPRDPRRTVPSWNEFWNENIRLNRFDVSRNLPTYTSPNMSGTELSHLPYSPSCPIA
jgi:hypothetical protein